MRSMSSQTGRATYPILWTLAAVVAVGGVILCYLARFWVNTLWRREHRTTQAVGQRRRP